MNNVVTNALSDAHNHTRGIARSLISNTVFFEDKERSIPVAYLTGEQRKKAAATIPDFILVGVIPEHLQDLATERVRNKASAAICNAVSQTTNTNAGARTVVLFETPERLRELNDARGQLGLAPLG